MSRLGVTIPPHNPHLDTAQVSGLVQSAEQLGYDAAFLPEAWSYDTTCVMTRCGLETERIQIGSSILPLEPRTPAQTAMAAVAIDDASQGRLILGLGVGHRHKEENWHGLDYRPRVDRMREYVEIVREIASGREMDYDGDHLRCGGYALGITPYRRDFPIYLAALGLRTHRLVGEIADGVLAYYAPPLYVKRIVEVIHEGAESAGRDPSEIEIGLMIPTHVTDDPDAARTIGRKQIAWYNNFENYNDMFRNAGFADEADALREAWAKVRERDPEMLEWQAAQGNDCGTAEIVTDEMVESIFVFGDADEVQRRIEGYREVGVDLPIVFPQGSFDDAESSIEAYVRTMAGARAGSGDQVAA
jgi:alkanesulfonate monooxygenase SsuD/methylene tetrahydromethanopterin reductase-like flavin-dependent oxidoreductase (luciferase family)